MLFDKIVTEIHKKKVLDGNEIKVVINILEEALQVILQTILLILTILSFLKNIPCIPSKQLPDQSKQ